MTLSPQTSEPVRHAPVPPWSKILATPLHPLEVIDVSPRNEILVTWYDVADNQQTIDINGVQSTVYQVWLSSHF